jgi:hypothetical protein
MLPSSHVEVEEIKKGLKSPCFRAPPRLAGGSSTPGDAPSYENDNPEPPHDLRLSRRSFPRAFLLDAVVISIVAMRVKANAAGV